MHPDITAASKYVWILLRLNCDGQCPSSVGSVLFVSVVTGLGLLAGIGYRSPSVITAAVWISMSMATVWTSLSDVTVNSQIASEIWCNTNQCVNSWLVFICLRLAGVRLCHKLAFLLHIAIADVATRRPVTCTCGESCKEFTCQLCCMLAFITHLYKWRVP